MADFDPFEFCASQNVAMVVSGASATTTQTTDICADLTVLGDAAAGAMPNLAAVGGNLRIAAAAAFPNLAAVGGNLLIVGDAAAGAFPKLTTAGGTLTVTGVRSEGALAPRKQRGGRAINMNAHTHSALGRPWHFLGGWGVFILERALGSHLTRPPTCPRGCRRRAWSP